ncbi:hypothetical protein KOW79_019953 [Hemibagrus wyckioides]|uniref:Uncharacterized protein n=1 Tax=Hemibagrus wyckioides TaxID=337641 RepID=A0A9D3N8N2_9TELE|nr:hypothetical protein KOW79_019953 [Hemibagrus wyckioides]
MGRSALMTLIGPYLGAAPWGIPPGTQLQPPDQAGTLSSSASPKANMGTVSCLNRLGVQRYHVGDRERTDSNRKAIRELMPSGEPEVGTTSYAKKGDEEAEKEAE